MLSCAQNVGICHRDAYAIISDLVQCCGTNVGKKDRALSALSFLLVLVSTSIAEFPIPKHYQAHRVG